MFSIHPALQVFGLHSKWISLKQGLNMDMHAYACTINPSHYHLTWLLDDKLQMNLLYPSLCNIPQYSIQNQQTHLHFSCSPREYHIPEPAESDEDPLRIQVHKRIVFFSVYTGYVFIYVYIYIYVCLYVCIYVCMYVCMYTAHVHVQVKILPTYCGSFTIFGLLRTQKQRNYHVSPICLWNSPKFLEQTPNSWIK